MELFHDLSITFILKVIETLNTLSMFHTLSNTFVLKENESMELFHTL